MHTQYIYIYINILRTYLYRHTHWHAPDNCHFLSMYYMQTHIQIHANIKTHIYCNYCINLFRSKMSSQGRKFWMHSYLSGNDPGNFPYGSNNFDFSQQTRKIH